jgi:hypothetical protein
MKKYTQSWRHLKFIQRRAKRSLAARLRFKRYKSNKNRVENHLKRSDRKDVRKRRQLLSSGFTRIDAPDVLSFVRNPEEVARFISELRHLEQSRHPVYVILKQVKEIDYDGITVLLSAVVRFKSRKISFNGDFPDDKAVRRTIEESGFFEYINDKFKDRDQYELSRKKIYTHAKKNVDSVLGQKIIEAASQTVWGEIKRCPGVQRVLLELMQNTNNHASFGGVGEKHWWLSVKHIKDEHRVIFSFVDYGVGVFNSLKNKRPDSKFYGIIEHLYKKTVLSITGGSDAAVLRLIFEGELHKTATGKTYRGKGLPGIYQALQKNQITNLCMITNKVFFNSARNEYDLLHTEFEGTFVYWELNVKNSNVR